MPAGYFIMPTTNNPEQRQELEQGFEKRSRTLLLILLILRFVNSVLLFITSLSYWSSKSKYQLLYINAWRKVMETLNLWTNKIQELQGHIF